MLDPPHEKHRSSITQCSAHNQLLLLVEMLFNPKFAVVGFSKVAGPLFCEPVTNHICTSFAKPLLPLLRVRPAFMVDPRVADYLSMFLQVLFSWYP